MSCNFTSSYELAFNITYGLFEAIEDVCPSTYIRPDPASERLVGVNVRC